MTYTRDRTAKQRRASLDRKSSAFVRSHGRCESCGTVIGLTNSHIISRGAQKVQFDPRNTQCICGKEHDVFTAYPLKHADYVRRSSCHQYEEVMTEQSRDNMRKPDYAVWEQIHAIIKEEKMTLIEAREWLGQTLIETMLDIPEVIPR